MGENNLIENPNCKYFGQDRFEKPTCREKGISQNIQDDENPGVCKINKKRVDREWGPWEVVTINTADEFEKKRVQPMLVDFAHGGKIGSDEIREIHLTWVKWVNEPKTWSAARENCVQMGGQLFHSLDGSGSQLDWLYSKCGGTSAWVGAYTMDQNHWYSVAGNMYSPSQLLWLTGEPTKGNYPS